LVPERILDRRHDFGRCQRVLDRLVRCRHALGLEHRGIDVHVPTVDVGIGHGCSQARQRARADDANPVVVQRSGLAGVEPLTADHDHIASRELARLDGHAVALLTTGHHRQRRPIALWTAEKPPHRIIRARRKPQHADARSKSVDDPQRASIDEAKHDRETVAVPRR
jgi:hypothetical protein